MERQKKIGLNQSRQYRLFIDDRNRALEVILSKYMKQINAIVRYLNSDVIASAALFRDLQSQDMKYVDANLDLKFISAADRVSQIITKMSTVSWSLAYLGEAEAIARATATRTQYHLSKEKAHKQSLKPMMHGGHHRDIAHLAFQKLKRRVLDAVHKGIVYQDNESALIERINSAFPQTKRIRQVRKKLKGPKKFKEALPRKSPEVYETALGISIGAGPEGDASYSVGYVDSEMWQSILDVYKAKYLPVEWGRGWWDQVSVDEDKYDYYYIWELERDTTQKFVESVRAGQVEAANENGYTDFVWIAIIDKSTCEQCCLWKDGMTTTEIEEQLKGAHADDPCQVAVPPAHVNCRCDLAPVTDALPDKPITDLGDFETWLG